MLTKDRLANALADEGLSDLALRARRGEFDALEQRTDKAMEKLMRTLSALRFTTPAARRMLRRVYQGEFTNTKAEINKWLKDHPEVKL